MIAFGGAGLRTAYVTTANPLDAAQREPQPLWGALFAFEAPAPGVAIPLLDDAYFR
jgi:sugar lactone lactonase YvrE